MGLDCLFMVKTNGLLKTQAYEEYDIKNKILVINILSMPPKALLILILRKSKIKNSSIGSLDCLFSTKLINQLVLFLSTFCNRILSYHILLPSLYSLKICVLWLQSLLAWPLGHSPLLKFTCEDIAPIILWGGFIPLTNVKGWKFQHRSRFLPTNS